MNSQSSTTAASRLAGSCSLFMLFLAACGCTGLRAPNLDAVASKTGDSLTQLLLGQQEKTSYLSPDGTVLSHETEGWGTRSQAEKVYYATREAIKKNAIVLHVPADENAVRVLPLPDDGRTVYVNQLIKQSGVGEALGRIDVTVFRHAPGTLNGLPLECHLSKGENTVRPECDYALHPGDRVQIRRAEGFNLVDTILQR